MRGLSVFVGIFVLVLSGGDGWAVTTAKPSSSQTKGGGVATFAGGCFWCMVPPFAMLPGVKQVVSGYTGGHKDNPTYHEVSAGQTGHAEAIQVIFDASVVSYEKLLDVFWHNIDPTDSAGQFCDKGNQYRSAIFYHGPEQKRLAEESRESVMKSGKLPEGLKVATEIVGAGKFYPAEDYHQDYYKKNPIRYKYYRYSCGRDQILRQVWGDAVGTH